MQNLSFDHYTIKVSNLAESSEFYMKILGLEEIENRTQKEYIRWFSMGGAQELHLVEGDIKNIKTDVGVHIAFKLSDFDDFIRHLKNNNITIHNSKAKPGEITVRTDGVRQAYFQDPDGYWIEVNEAANPEL